MERRQTDESGQAAGGTVPILGARHEHKCRLGEARELPYLTLALSLPSDGPERELLNLSEANHLPAAAGASLRVSSSVADIRLTIFLPDPRVNRSPT
jgi:hypothetical protein